jgi:hypothetical protein
MRPPGPIIAFFATWGANNLTTTEPDIKFGDSAPYIARYTAGWSPLPIAGTLAAWFAGCAAVYMATLYVSHGLRGDA